jgi:hypothetical protein
MQLGELLKLVHRFVVFPFFRAVRRVEVARSLLEHADGKSFEGSGVIKDGRAADLTAVVDRAKDLDDELFEEDVRGVLNKGANGRDKKIAGAATRLLQAFEKSWNGGGAAPKKDAVAPAPPAPKRPASKSNGASGKAAAAAAAKDVSEKEKRALVEKLAGLTAKALVEALHVAKTAQPDLDVGLDPEKIVLPIDDMSNDCLNSLIAFCANK